MTAPLIELHSVSKAYGSHEVLRDISFEVKPGEILGLVGPNGTGKTTTIRLINGVIVPRTGRISVDGRDPAQEGEAVRQLSGILTESAGFYGHMTGLENLRFFGELYGVTGDRRPLELLAEFGLSDAASQRVGAYSTGMKKRLGLAKALLHRPKVLFLDEPTNGLDPEGIRMVLEYIRKLNQRDGTTMILCSHLLQQLESVCHRYVFVQRGQQGAQVIEQGTLAQLEERYLGQVMLRVESPLAPTGDSFAGVPVRRAGEGLLEFTLPTREQIPDLLRAILREADLFGATTVGADLESIYFKIKEANRHE